MSCESDSAEDLSALSSRSVETSDLHIWRISASEWGSEVPLLMTVMSQDERERACRFVFEADRSRFIVARGLLRFLLSAYTSRLPEELTFGSGRNGKPFLNTQDDVNFNVSHSGEIVLIAISRGQQVGIDVECGGRTFSVQNLAQSCLTECEYSAFKRLPKEEREEAFLRCWVRKEACVKATGDGLSVAPECIEVGVGTEPLHHTVYLNGSDVPWSITDLDLDSGIVGAVVFEEQRAELKYRSLRRTQGVYRIDRGLRALA